ncbi:MAG: O-antigen ligase family protein [bacterium]|nr:O-antigen ligase family protein [bacterium]
MNTSEIKRIDWVLLVVVLVSAPLFLFPRKEFIPFLFVLPLVRIFRTISHKRPIERTLPDIPIIILSVHALISTLTAANAGHGFPKLMGLIFSITLYYACLPVLKGVFLKKGIPVFLVGGVGFAVLGLMGMASFTLLVKRFDFLLKIKEKIPQLDFKLPGAEMGFAPNAIGGTLVLIVPLLVMLLYLCLPEKLKLFKIPGAAEYRRPGKRVFLLLAAALFLVLFVLMMTLSRGAWLGLIVSFGILLLALSVKKKRVLVSLLVLLLVFSFVAVPKLLKTDGLRLDARQVSGTFMFRMQMWDRALPHIMANPFLGIGLNGFRHLPEVKYEISHAHNKLFHIAVELGLPGLTVYIALLMLMVYMTVSGWKKLQDPWLKLSMLGLGIGQAAHLIFEMTDVIPLGSKVGVFFWLSLALMSALYNHAHRLENEKCKK